MRHTIAAAFLVVLAPVAAAAQPGAVATVAAYNQGINAIETAGAAPAQRVARFEPLVARTYDMPAIAALVAGPAWARASAADRAAATTALTHHSAVALAKNFKGPGATAFRIDPAPIRRGGDQVVKVTAGDDVLFYRTRGGRIIDVIAGGVSQLALQRADLAGTLSAGGVAGMTRKLGQLDAR